MSNVETARKVAEWLASLSGANGIAYSDIVPVEVTIANKVYCGCRYTVTYSDKRKDVRYYIIGDLPELYKKRQNNTCFRFEKDGSDWYIAGFFNKQWMSKNGYPVDPEKEKYHPFGEWWGLHEWSHQGSAIDDGERFRYKRHPITVVEIS